MKTIDEKDLLRYRSIVENFDFGEDYLATTPISIENFLSSIEIFGLPKALVISGVPELIARREDVPTFIAFWKLYDEDCLNPRKILEEMDKSEVMVLNNYPEFHRDEIFGRYLRRESGIDFRFPFYKENLRKQEKEFEKSDKVFRIGKTVYFL